MSSLRTADNRDLKFRWRDPGPPGAARSERIGSQKTIAARRHDLPDRVRHTLAPQLNTSGQASYQTAPESTGKKPAE
ncbi:hypothetical protein Pve01_37690 [Planomonospora venezuelensis]|nr:hypothetical protein Pve01_37690 [Planomonospora venezuelensis]